MEITSSSLGCMACLVPVVSVKSNSKNCVWYVKKSVFSAGRHCCLWCLITADKLRDPPADGAVGERTTENIISDNRRYVQAGSVLKNAKLFNNAIQKPFFQNIPLSQV